MKKIILLSLTFFLFTNLFGQTDSIKKNTLRTSFAANWYYGCYFSDGITYTRRASEKYSWGVGLEHSWWEQNFRRSITVPLRVTRHYRRPIFLSCGLLLNMDSYDYYGIRTEHYFHWGAELGMGYERTFPTGIAFSVFPHLRMVGLGNQQLEISCRAGISVGVGYKF